MIYDNVGDILKDHSGLASYFTWIIYLKENANIFEGMRRGTLDCAEPRLFNLAYTHNHEIIHFIQGLNLRLSF